MHYVVDGGPRHPAGSRLVARQGNARGGPVGPRWILSRVVEQLVPIPPVPGRIRSSEL